MTEIWKDIKDYEGLYQISNLGRVKRLAYKRYIKSNDKIQIMNFKERILHPVLHQNGYHAISLSKNNKRKIFLIHRLVATHFLSNSIAEVERQIGISKVCLRKKTYRW